MPTQGEGKEENQPSPAQPRASGLTSSVRALGRQPASLEAWNVWLRGLEVTEPARVRQLGD